MIRSMTAFGRSALKVYGGKLSCEIRSVNNRFLDINLRLASSIRGAESDIRRLFTQSLQRGKVEATLTFTPSKELANSVLVDQALLRELAEAAGHVETLTQSPCVVDSVALLQWPGVVTTENLSLSVSHNDACQVAEQALQDFIATREREGRHLSEMLLSRNQQLIERLQQLRAQRPIVLERQRVRLLAKLEELGVDYDETRLEQELVYGAQRLDIDEELDRLQAHTKELGQALQRDEPVGRRLDFLMQEFNREINTIGSKSLDKQTTAITVDMKVLIEQMREQVQNIE